uniref:Uncharacterized protein n=1 Tax=viral metagenome TaxID=1070528 RepID=A0A6C0JT30_9ZZZZ
MTERMNAFDLYLKWKDRKERAGTIEERAIRDYQYIKHIIDQRKFSLESSITYNFWVDNNRSDSVCVMERTLEMLREDGFHVWHPDRDQIQYRYTISWGPDIPAVQFGLDGPAYNENIIN